MTMKFNVRSALPSTALVLLSLMVVGKTHKVYSKTMQSYQSSEATDPSFGDDQAFFIDDSFSSGDSFCSGDSFGSGDSFCSGDSADASIPDGNSYGVWTVERDSVQDNVIVFPEVVETLCVKKFENVFIAQSPGSFNYPSPFGPQTVIAKGKIKPRKGLLKMEYAGDPNIGSIKTTDFRLNQLPGDAKQWQGTWKSGKTTGDVVVRMSFGDGDYFANACDFYLGQ